MFHKQLICSLAVTFCMVLAYPTYADRHDDKDGHALVQDVHKACLLYTSPSPRDGRISRMPSSA